MSNDDRYYNERINNTYDILDAKIVKMQETLYQKLDQQQDAIKELTRVLMNGVSHRTKENNEAIKRIQANLVTKEEFKAALSDRGDADAAHIETRRWKVRTWLLGVGLVLSAGGLVWSVASQMGG